MLRKIYHMIILFLFYEKKLNRNRKVFFYFPSHVGVSVFAVKVMDSPGLSQVLVGGACSRMRLHVILGSFTVTVSVCDTVMALDLIPVL